MSTNKIHNFPESRHSVSVPRIFVDSSIFEVDLELNRKTTALPLIEEYSPISIWLTSAIVKTNLPWLGFKAGSTIMIDPAGMGPGTQFSP